MFLGKTVAPPAAVLEYCVVAYVSIGALLLLPDLAHCRGSGVTVRG